MIAHRVTAARITFVERESALVALCRENIALKVLLLPSFIAFGIYLPFADRDISEYSLPWVLVVLGICGCVFWYLSYVYDNPS